MEFKTLEDKCKWYEKNFSPERCIPKLPVILRFDGVGFSKYTKSMNKPFDIRFSNAMDRVASDLLKETGAIVSYTQSDEISIILYSGVESISIYQDGKKSKMLSKLSSFVTLKFNKYICEEFGKEMPSAMFDCRLYQVPTLDDATLQLLWRENDATRNSIQGLAYYNFGHSKIFCKTTKEMQEMLMTEKGINWNDLSSRDKRGVYFTQHRVETPFTPEEIAKLSPKHNYFKDPNMVVSRVVVNKLEIPKLSSIKNKVDVFFNDLEPILHG